MKKTEATKRRGAVIPSTGKTRVTMFLDDDVIEHYRERATKKGRGYQTEINAVLRATMEAGDADTTGVVTGRVCIQDIYSQMQGLKQAVGHIETMVFKGFKDLPVVITDISMKGGPRRYGAGERKVEIRQVTKKPTKRPSARTT